jgi:transposase
VPSTTLREIPPEEHAQRRAVLRRTRSGDLLAFHRLLVGAVGRNPTEMAAFLCCARSRVYRLVRAYRPGSLGSRVDQAGQRSSAVPSTLFRPWLTRALGTILTKAPRVYGWGRPRWRWATLAATLQATHGIEVAADTRRRWLHERGWVWKRAKRVAQDDDPQRIER